MECMPRGKIKEHMNVDRDPPSPLAEKWREVLILGRERAPQEWLKLDNLQ